MTPGELLKAVRRRRGLTQAELARRAGTSQPVVSAYEHDRRDPAVGTLRRLVAAGGERLRLDAAPPAGDLKPPATPEEHARRLLDVLSLADAVPTWGAAQGAGGAAHGLVLTTLSLAQRIVAIDRGLETLPHAFGGAIALAYYAEPRATIDIDLNVFVDVSRFGELAAHLVDLGIDAAGEEVRQLVERNGQVRVFWDATPIDLFLAYDAFHHAARGAVRVVPFADTTIPILAPEHLVVCKAVDRAKDWVDIDAMVATDVAIDVAEVLRWVGRIAGDTDPRYDRIAGVLTRS